MLKNLTLRNKLMLMGILIGVLAPILGMYVRQKLADVSLYYDQVAGNKMSKTRVLGELQFEFRQIRIPVRSLPVIGTSASEIRKHISDTEAAIGAFVQSLGDYENSIEYEEERNVFNKLNGAWQTFFKFGGQVLNLAAQFDENPSVVDRIAVMIRETCARKAAPVEQALKELVKFQTTEARTYVEKANQVKQEAMMAVWIGSGLSLMIAIALATLISNGLNGQIRRMVKQLRNMNTSLRNSSQQLEKSANNLSTSTTEESAALAETAASMEEVSAMIDQTSRYVSSTLKVTNDGNTAAQSGRRDVQRMLSSMNSIQESNDKLEKIVKLIEEIKGKTRVINDIVFETRLLSFNASIEAARAGAQGKGFAVVAEEVGNLASVSGKAADEIRNLLESSTMEVNDIVRSTKEIIGLGRTNAEECEKAFEQMRDYLERIAQSVRSIESASREQERGVKECNAAVAQMDQLSHNISFEAEGLLEEAKRLSDDASIQGRSVNRLNRMIEGRRPKVDRDEEEDEYIEKLTLIKEEENLRAKDQKNRKKPSTNRVKRKGPDTRVNNRMPDLEDGEIEDHLASDDDQGGDFEREDPRWKDSA